MLLQQPVTVKVRIYEEQGDWNQIYEYSAGDEGEREVKKTGASWFFDDDDKSMLFVTDGFDDSVQRVKISVELFENDDSNDDDRCDISGRPTSGDDGSDPDESDDHGRKMIIIYDLLNGNWVEEENGILYEGFEYTDPGDYTTYVSDSDGVGFSSGYEGPNDYEPEGGSRDNCQIYFDLWPSDKDGNIFDWDEDKLTSKCEEEILHTNSAKKDSDGDGFEDWWEHRFGRNPNQAPNAYGPEITYYRNDNDGIADEHEYKFFEFCALPDRKDIFVETDSMKKEGSAIWHCREHILYQHSQFQVTNQFARHSITLHIDDGRMGGGGDKVDHDFLTTYEEWRTTKNYQYATEYYWDYDFETSDPVYSTVRELDYDKNSIVTDNFAKERVGIFIHCFIGHYLNEKGRSESGYVGGLAEREFGLLFIAGYPIHYNWHRNEAEQQMASTFMHELGHMIGLNADYYYDSTWYFEAYIGHSMEFDIIPDDKYQSCMKYTNSWQIFHTPETQVNPFNADHVGYSSKSGEITVYEYDHLVDGVPYFYEKTLDTDEWGRIDLDYWRKDYRSIGVI